MARCVASLKLRDLVAREDYIVGVTLVESSVITLVAIMEDYQP